MQVWGKIIKPNVFYHVFLPDGKFSMQRMEQLSYIMEMFRQLSSIEEVIVYLGDYELKSPFLQMLQFQVVVVHLALVIALLQWHSTTVLLVEAASEPLGPSAALGMGAHPFASEEKSATNLAAKLFLLDELVSLENEVTETKKKRSFPGFGFPIDKISSTSADVKGKQRKVVELPKRRFGVPLDRIGVSRLGNTKG